MTPAAGVVPPAGGRPKAAKAVAFCSITLCKADVSTKPRSSKA